MERFLRSYAVYVLVWIVFTIMLFAQQGPWNDLTYRLLALSTFLLYSHVLFGGYFLFWKEPHYSWKNLVPGFFVVVSIIGMILLIQHYLWWSLCGVILLSIAIIFHLGYKSMLKRVAMQEFVNYKIFIELSGIIIVLGGMLVYWAFPQLLHLLAWGGVLFVFRLNWLIFHKKRLYWIDYENPSLSKEPLVSVVVIAYNEEKFIGKTLLSLKNQSYKKIEVIVVDDHSTDKTVEMVHTFDGSFPLQVVQKEVKGPSRSRNYGATFARGELILFLDSDVVLSDTFIEQAVSQFHQQQLSVATADFSPISDHKRDSWISSFYRRWLKVVQYFNPRGVGVCIMIEKHIHEKIRGFDESIIMSEDFDYVVRSSFYGKYRIMEHVGLQVSWRRFEEENRVFLVLKYLYFEWYRQNIGEIRKSVVKYEFGKHDGKKE